MKWFVLSQSGRILFPWLIVLSLIVLYRGHNLPGGGFIGGLLCAAAFILVGLGDGMEAAKRRLILDPVTVLGLGLGVAVISGLPGLFSDKHSYFVDQWLPDFYLPLLGAVHIGTPLIFDIGVFVVVVGFILHSVFSLDTMATSPEPNQTSKKEVE